MADGTKKFEWRLPTGKRIVSTPPRRWSSDLVKIAGTRWFETSLFGVTWRRTMTSNSKHVFRLIWCQILEPIRNKMWPLKWKPMELFNNDLSKLNNCPKNLLHWMLSTFCGPIKSMTAFTLGSTTEVEIHINSTVPLSFLFNTVC